MIVDVDKLLAANTEILVRDISEFNLMMYALDQNDPLTVRRWMKADGTWKHPWELESEHVDVSEVYFIVHKMSGLCWSLLKRPAPFERNRINFCDVVTYDDEDSDISSVDVDIFALMR